jgi:hypothetical protein
MHNIAHLQLLHPAELLPHLPTTKSQRLKYTPCRPSQGTYLPVGQETYLAGAHALPLRTSHSIACRAGEKFEQPR